MLFVLQAKPQKPQSVIFDTDMGPDYDDVGAITMLHAFADQGEINILATVASTNYDGVAGVLNVLNTYFKRPGLLIGVPKKNGLKLRDWQHWTDTLLAKYPHKIKSNNEVPDAVDIYRKILSMQPDHSVTIITVGFLTNLSNLLQSKPDKYSELPGSMLVDKKIRKLVCMAGRFPSGNEFNVREDSAASQYVFSNWPSPVIFSGFEIGQKIKCGLPFLSDNTIKNSPVKDVFRICIPKAAEDSAGRMSWDETAVLVGVKGIDPWYTIVGGHIEVADNGSNSWNAQGIGQFYLVEKMVPVAVQEYINKMIFHQPRREVKKELRK